MLRTWGPSGFGKLVTGSGSWQLTLADDGLTVRDDGGSFAVGMEALTSPIVLPGVLWSRLVVPCEGRSIVLRGIPSRSARELGSAIELLLGIGEVKAWAAGFFDAALPSTGGRRWLSRDFCLRWEKTKPGERLGKLLREPLLAGHIAALDNTAQKAIRFWSTDLEQYIAGLNADHMSSELESCADLFDRVERSPLTREQAHAVICFDNRVQVIASAGSGKTSTMVAKTAYALHRNLVPAEKILLLAFNKDAAEELKQRIKDRAHPLDLDGDQVAARTFHAFGLEVIGKATGRKPALAPWLENGRDHEHLMRLVDGLRDTDPGFRGLWDFFRIVLGSDLPEFGQEQDDPNLWETATNASALRTLQGETVKSHGEQMIADWLFYNGVQYKYEARYEHDTTDAEHRQYCPDFYYPAIDTYHEHFALDTHGRAPRTGFEGYLDGVTWKRATHQQHGTTLLETTTAGTLDGTAFSYLERELTDRGLTLDPNPDRPVPGRQVIENADLVRTFRTFLIHAKSNRLDDAALRDNLKSRPGLRNRFRHSIFLTLFGSIRDKWEQELAAENYIDFEDMLNHAADHIEAGRWDSGYELVMVDEMQDASHARARLVRALVNHSDRYLFAVGDDWQSINRFAGADLSVMTDFHRWFGPGQTLRLERTFRSPQSVSDISSAFIQKNPQQLPKKVKSLTPEIGTPVRIVAVSNTNRFANSADRFAGAVNTYLEQLNREVRAGEVPAGAEGQVQVRILARYRHLLNSIPAGYGNGWDHLNIQMNTVHGAKGLEADYIVILGMTKGRYGFPSTIIDDPVLELAMPDGDTYPLAEERRLFYVALTRARRSVLLLTVEGQESPFIKELMKDHGLTLQNLNGQPMQTVICPKCGNGFMTQRSGKYGTFYGCSEYPACTGTMNTATYAKTTNSPAAQPRPKNTGMGGAFPN
nr:UvrD-helicase domain-containing protein [Arthrobacter sp. 162MFSha1.1]